MARPNLRAVFALGLAATFVVGACSQSSTGVDAPLAGEVTVFAASSLVDAFGRIGNELREANPDARINLNFGSSSTLATQITNGAPADVFASADEINMQKIVNASLANGAPTEFASNRLEIAVAAGNPKKVSTLADLARRDVVLVIAAPSVPAGQYALQALAKAGVAANPVSQEIDVRAVLNKVILGEADAGIVYVSDVKSAGARVTGVDIPDQHQVIAHYPIRLRHLARGAASARGLWFLAAVRPERPPILIATLAIVAVGFFVLPLVGLLARAPWQTAISDLTTTEALTALRLSFVVSLAATALFGRRGLFGPVLEAIGIRVPFTTFGAILAATFVAMPFLVLTVEAGLRSMDRRYEDAARTLGAGRWLVFRRVTLPLIAPSVFAGAVLSWARALGEFGATITFAGNLPGTTQTLPLAVYIALETRPEVAIMLSLVLLAVALAILVVMRDRYLRAF
ncbi:MAG: molybdate ABC transporter substrate-binding protein [Chloroflexi bacterium]|nr:MAG: molybdate ABC transporter substrate-binding protein [Chloroflexota bacterium]